MFNTVDYFKGKVVIELTNGDKRHIDVEDLMIQPNGEIMFLITKEKDYYNFNNVIRIHKETRVF